MACLVGVRKTVEQHIEGHLKALEAHPEIKNKGFMEREMNNTIDVCGPMASVRSCYLKRYFDEKGYIEKEGINCLLLAFLDNCPKVVAMGWYEPSCDGGS